MAAGSAVGPAVESRRCHADRAQDGRDLAAVIAPMIQDLGEDDTNRDVVNLRVPGIWEHEPAVRIVGPVEEVLPEDRARLGSSLELCEIRWPIRRPPPRGPLARENELVEALGTDDVPKRREDAPV